MYERYPQIDQSDSVSHQLLDREAVAANLTILYDLLCRHSPQLEKLVMALRDEPNMTNLRAVCDYLFPLLPMWDEDKRLYSLTTTQMQIQCFLDGNTYGIGDCKLITILTAYICTVICHLPVVVSIRNYSEHPVLYVNINSTNFKVTFLHEGTEIKPFVDDDPFRVTAEKGTVNDFYDTEFTNATSILYWKISDAIFILDCMNLLRRAVVNYILDPETYLKVFNDALVAMQVSGIYSQPVIFYWEGELSRVQSLYNDWSLYLDTPDMLNTLKNRIAESLRF